MKSTNILLLLILQLCIVCAVGCESNKKSLYLDESKRALEERIAKYSKLEDGALAPSAVTHRKHFVTRCDRTALSTLNKLGMTALSKPLVLWGAISPNPVAESENSEELDYESFLHVEWLESEPAVTGFFFELENDRLVEFPGTVRMNDEHFQELRGNGFSMYTLVFFSSIKSQPSRDILKLDAEEFSLIVEQKKAVRVGLILSDGSKSDPAPVSYSESL